MQLLKAFLLFLISSVLGAEVEDLTAVESRYKVKANPVPYKPPKPAPPDFDHFAPTINPPLETTVYVSPSSTTTTPFVSTTKAASTTATTYFTPTTTARPSFPVKTRFTTFRPTLKYDQSTTTTTEATAAPTHIRTFHKKQEKKASSYYKVKAENANSGKFRKVKKVFRKPYNFRDADPTDVPNKDVLLRESEQPSRVVDRYSKSISQPTFTPYTSSYTPSYSPSTFSASTPTYAASTASVDYANPSTPSTFARSTTTTTRPQARVRSLDAGRILQRKVVPQYDQSLNSLSHEEENFFHEDQPYSFRYDVNDDYHGTNYYRTEERSGQVTKGSYKVALPDGRVQIVSYVADENGYKATVSYQGEAIFPSPDGRSPSAVARSSRESGFRHSKKVEQYDEGIRNKLRRFESRIQRQEELVQPEEKNREQENREALQHKRQQHLEQIEQHQQNQQHFEQQQQPLQHKRLPQRQHQLQQQHHQQHIEQQHQEQEQHELEQHEQELHDQREQQHQRQHQQRQRHHQQQQRQRQQPQRYQLHQRQQYQRLPISRTPSSTPSPTLSPTISQTLSPLLTPTLPPILSSTSSPTLTPTPSPSLFKTVELNPIKDEEPPNNPAYKSLPPLDRIIPTTYRPDIAHSSPNYDIKRRQARRFEFGSRVQ